MLMDGSVTSAHPAPRDNTSGASTSANSAVANTQV